MTSLILKRAKFSRPSGEWKDEDYDVLADGKVVGRIYDQGSAGTPRGMRWFWSITPTIVLTPEQMSTRTGADSPPMNRGRAPRGPRTNPYLPSTKSENTTPREP